MSAAPALKVSLNPQRVFGSLPTVPVIGDRKAASVYIKYKSFIIILVG
jgi:hypothetical protein